MAAGGLEPSERLIGGLIVLTAILTAGTVGYMALGLGLLDSLYQTVITISTVGYSDPENVGGRYQLFTIILILLGTGTSLYMIGVVFEMLLEGRLDDQLRRRRMQRDIDQLSGHSVICGYGQVGRAIAAVMIDQGADVVVIDRDPDVSMLDAADLSLRWVSGDATHDSVLRDAGVERAETMVLALDSDVDNLYVALSARSLCPELFIVARANSADAAPKLHRAGADRVINPHQLGGSRMAAIALQPGVADYLDEVIGRTDQDVRLLEHRIVRGSKLVGKSVAELDLAQRAGCEMLAIRRDNRWFAISRAAQQSDAQQSAHRLAEHDLLVVLGTAEQLSLALALFDAEQLSANELSKEN